uniref:ATP synthase mitochondrial F1 complex assembly factor 1 n=1 Tax=Clastoptera arizonana TaxID=38151 RepID=A0A1B6CZN3_9HEMI
MEFLQLSFKIYRCVNLKISRIASSPNLVKYQRNIVTSVMNVSKVEEDLKTNPYFEKYAGKIAKLQKTSPEEYLSRLETMVEGNNKSMKNTASKETLSIKPGEPKSTTSFNFTKTKSLDDILKVNLILDKCIKDIAEIWTNYHKDKSAISAIIPVDKYDLIMKRSKLYPIFLLPLPRNQGYEFIVCQFSANEVHFTPLISYQTHKENSPECLTIVYFPDLRDKKNIIFMKGEYNKDIINGMEAQCLANELQLYYGEENEKRTNLLQRFTNNSDDFKHMDLIANLETLSF